MRWRRLLCAFTFHSWRNVRWLFPPLRIEAECRHCGKVTS